MNRIHNSWTQLERLELDMVKNLESNKMYTNMIVWMKMPEAQKGMAQMAEGIDGINTAVDESAQGVTMAAQSTGELVEALVTIKGEADTNREISEDLQGEVKRFKHI